MPKLNKVLHGCGYDARHHVIGFRVDDHAVVIDNRQMLIIGAETEAQARAVLDWLTEKIMGDENDVEKDGNHLRKEQGWAD